MSIVGVEFPKFRSIAVFESVFMFIMKKLKFMAWQTNLQAPTRFLIVCYKKNTSSETFKFPNTIGNPFQDFYFIVKSFGWSIGDMWIFKSMKDFF